MSALDEPVTAGYVRCVRRIALEYLVGITAAIALPPRPVIAQVDTLARARVIIDSVFAPADVRRNEMLARLKADSGTARADTLFWNWMTGYSLYVDSISRPLHNPFFDVLIDPLGAASQQLRRERHEEVLEAPTPRERARADSVHQMLRRHGVDGSDSEGEVEYAVSTRIYQADFGPFIGSLSRVCLDAIAYEATHSAGDDGALRISWAQLATLMS